MAGLSAIVGIILALGASHGRAPVKATGAQQSSLTNLAAAANGASIVAYSSEYTPGWEATCRTSREELRNATITASLVVRPTNTC